MQIITQLTYFFLLLLYALAFDELINFANADFSVQEMQKAGKEQYQILQERGKLPRYGDCWKAALEHVEESCRQLTEETQSDVALHITNCFLEMSGHDTYSCESDKKPNLRAICLQSMTDRAFNVYIEFFTHAQNICYFLRGQLWQETIEENTRKVGKQLDRSSKNQETLLKNQEASLEMQERMLKYGEEIDEMLARFVASTKQHQELIHMLSASVNNLQSWLIGEVSWIDTAVFYLVASFVVVFLTSTPRTTNARLPMLILLGCNIFFERLLCYSIRKGEIMDAALAHEQYYSYVSYMRYTFVFLMAATLCFFVFVYKDYLVENHIILEDIKASMQNLKDSLQSDVKPIGQSERAKTPRRNRNKCIDEVHSSTMFYLDETPESTISRSSSRASNSRYNLRTRQTSYCS